MIVSKEGAATATAEREQPGDDRIATNEVPDPLRDPCIEQLARHRGWAMNAFEILGATECKEDGRVGEVRLPMRDAGGNVLGWRRRRADGKAFRNGSKALTNRGGEVGLFYAHPFSGEDDNAVLVVEGETDLLAALSAWPGLPVVGTPGAQAGVNVARELQSLLHGRWVVLAPDPGNAGRQWRETLGSALADAACTVSFIPPAGDKDLDERLRFAGDKREALETLMGSAMPSSEPQEAVERGQAVSPKQFFDDGTFGPLRLARYLKGRYTLAFGCDAESGAGRLMEYSGGVWRSAVGVVRPRLPGAVHRPLQGHVTGGQGPAGEARLKAGSPGPP